MNTVLIIVAAFISFATMLYMIRVDVPRRERERKFRNYQERKDHEH